MRKVKMNVCSIWRFAQISDDFYNLDIWRCAFYFVTALFKELVLITIIEMWGLESRSRTSRSRSRLLWQTLGLVSKSEPGLGLGGYGLDYITGYFLVTVGALHYSCIGGGDITAAHVKDHSTAMICSVQKCNWLCCNIGYHVFGNRQHIVEFVLAPQHEMSCNSETTTKDFDYWTKIIEESDLEVYWRIHDKTNEAEL